MAERIVVGSVVNECKFEIPQSSINNLNKFQKRLAQVKKQMQGLSGKITLQANAQIKAQQNLNKAMKESNKLNKVYDDYARKGVSITPNSLSKMDAKRRTSSNAQDRKDYSNFWKTALRDKEQEEIKAAKQVASAREKAEKEANARIIEEQSRERNRAKWIAAQETKAAFKQARELEKQSAAEARKLNTRKDTVETNRFRHENTITDYNPKTKDAKKLREELNRISEAFIKGDMSAKRYNAEITRVMQNTRKLGRENKSLIARLEELRSHIFLGAAVYETTEWAKKLRDVGLAFDGIHYGLLATSKTSDEANQSFEWLQQTTDKLGVNFKETAKEFVSMQAAAAGSMTNGQIKDLFQGISEYATATHASAFKVQLAMMGISQGLSIGTVQSEEFVHQMGENLPGSLQILQKSLHMTGQEMRQAMRNGTLKTAEIMPAFAKALKQSANANGALDKALKSTNAEMNRAKNAWAELGNAMYTAGASHAWRSFYQTMNSLAKILTPVAVMLSTALDTAFRTLLLPLQLVAGGIQDIAHYLDIDLNGSILKSIGHWAGYVLALYGAVKALGMVKGAINGVKAAFSFISLVKGGASIGEAMTTVGETAAVASKKVGLLRVLFRGLMSSVKSFGSILIRAVAGIAGLIGLPELAIGAGAAAIGYGGYKLIQHFQTDDAKKNAASAAISNANSSSYAARATRANSKLTDAYNPWSNYSATQQSGEVKHTVEVTVKDGKIEGLVDAKLTDHQNQQSDSASSYSM